MNKVLVGIAGKRCVDLLSGVGLTAQPPRGVEYD